MLKFHKILSRAELVSGLVNCNPCSNSKVTTYKVYEIFGWSPASDDL